MIRIRTGYSFRTAAGSADEVLTRLKGFGSEYAPITDRNSTFGWNRYSKKAIKLGLKPVFGVELPVTISLSEKKPVVDYWTFIAKGSIKPLNELVETATNQFRYQPLLNYDQAQRVDAIKVIGHRSDVNQIESSEDTFYALSPSVAKGYVRRMQERGIRPIASGDNRYCAPEDRGLWEVICGRTAERQSYPQHILSPIEWDAALGAFPTSLRAEALWNADTALGASTAVLPTATLLKPERPATLRAMCEAGARDLGVDLTNPVYSARMDRELKLIEDKNFEDYFYLVADMCVFARKNLIVGPARGSSCGSLVCYLLKITLIDPIPYGLIFERFIDITRLDLPDIDIDFSDDKRKLVFEYMSNKYGARRTARLGTVAIAHPRTILKAASGALLIPKYMCDAVADSIIERSSADARAMNTLEDTLREMPAGKALIEAYPEILNVVKMEGAPTHYSQHASGLVLTEDDVSNYVAVDMRTGATMCDKKDAEDLNMLKIDVLGLTQLSVFEDALELAGLPIDTLEKIPLDDPKAFEIINAGKFSGVFQFNGIALQSLAKQFKAETLDDLIATTALARPGPLASGGTNTWATRRTGRAPVEYPHPMFEPYLKDTLGVVVYQEQVMEIGRQIGDLTWDHVTALRKAMSKSLGKEFFDKFGDPWKKGAIAKGLDPAKADKIWDELCAYGSWAFNKSHSVAYGLISYQCCWLKAHYPFEFAAATLTREDDPVKQLNILREIVSEGYDYVPVDMEFSTGKWAVGFRNGGKVLVGPLQNVKGIGPAMVSAIIGARARGEPIPERARKLLTNPITPIDTLFPIKAAIKRHMPVPAEKNIFTAPTPIIKVQPTEVEEGFLIMGTPVRINPRNMNEAVLVAKRGSAMEGDDLWYLNMFFRDDTDEMFVRIGRFDYKNIGKKIVDYGRPGKAMYAIKGTIKQFKDSTFRMFTATAVRYIGDMDK